MIKASNSAARGISRPEVVYMDELSEMRDLDGFASLAIYDDGFSKSASLDIFYSWRSDFGSLKSTPGARLAAMVGGGTDNICYLEWSGATDDIYDQETGSQVIRRSDTRSTRIISEAS
jgi:hypothetical protein